MTGLQGIRVLDLTWAQAGPLATLILSDLGADVLKVEPPNGDITRGVGPFPGGVSWVFTALNRGKRSIVADLKTHEGRERVHRLAAHADVVVENYAPGVADRLGVGPGELRRRNPRLVYASCSGFGQDPGRPTPAFDLVIQALSGLLVLTGEPGSGPVRPGFSTADVGSALFLTIGIQQALLERERTGVGSRVDVSMIDAQLSMMWDPIGEFLTTGHAPEKLGSRHAPAAPFEGFATADGHVVVAVVTDEQFRRMAHALDADELAEDGRFACAADRVAHVDDLHQALAARFRTLTSQEVLRRLEGERVPVGPVHDVRGAVEQTPFVRGLTIDLGDLGPVLGTPIRREGIRAVRRERGPALGEHDEHVGTGHWPPP